MIEGIDLVVTRGLVETGLLTTLPLRPGDRALVAEGDLVAPDDPVIERLRDPVVEDALVADGPDVRVGARWSGEAAGTLRRRVAIADGELLAPHPGSAGRWRVVTADQRDLLLSPVAGAVVAVRPGVAIEIALSGSALRGVLAAGTISHGRLELATDRGGEVRSGSLDVGRAGSVLVVGARIDAEALIRARAMGVRGIVVASLAGKDLRDFLASERRQRAGIHPSPPFAVLVLEGIVRRPIPVSTMRVLEALAGREVAILTEPPALAFEGSGLDLPRPAPDLVRIRHGAHAGREGRFRGLAGRRRFDAGVHLEAGWVALDDGTLLAVPLNDLERRP
ncbi:MAG TPA: hypothetical protein VFK54_05795 [Candidatus Limnocylindrales bacterium]|nr:hypothetical protein [Candidatus Limnocylindrales bacterium]